jgi:hypothetical protein
VTSSERELLDKLIKRSKALEKRMDQLVGVVQASSIDIDMMRKHMRSVLEMAHVAIRKREAVMELLGNITFKNLTAQKPIATDEIDPEFWKDIDRAMADMDH